MRNVFTLAMGLMLIASTGMEAGLAPAEDSSDPVQADGLATNKMRILILYKANVTDSDIYDLSRLGAKIGRVYSVIPAIAAEVEEYLLDDVTADVDVKFVEPDSKVYALDAELDNSWGVKHIGAGSVHPYNKGSGLKVAILDTGIDLDHPDLTVVGHVTFVEGTTTGDDDNGHGTHCAGVVAALDNDTGVVGVAPEACLYAVKVLDNLGSGYISNVVAGIQWAINNGMHIISMSFGSNSPSIALQSACDSAYRSGLIVVAAAGNDYETFGGSLELNTIDYPARYDSVIAVGATDNTDTKASWSSTGPALELAAPGVKIGSTYRAGTYGVLSGTSTACPHVVGVAALVWAGKPELTNVQVRNILRDTAKDLGGAGTDNWYGYGIVDAGKAAPQIEPPATADQIPPEISNTAGNKSGTTGEAVRISATITDNVGVVSAKVYYVPIDGAETTILMTESAGNLWSADVPVAKDAVGQIIYYITAQDAAGNTAKNPTTGAYNITVTDNDAPVISSATGITMATCGQLVTISATITDNIGVVDATVRYKPVEGTGQIAEAMTKGSDDVWTATIPAGLKVGMISYYIVAKDAVPNAASNPKTGAYSVAVRSDMQAPSITDSTGNTSGTTGDPATVQAKITDNVRVISAAVYYVPINGTETPISMRQNDGDVWSADVPVAKDAVGLITYYIIAEDPVGNATRNPATRTYSITITDDDPPIVEAGPDKSVRIGEMVHFDGSDSSDNIGINSYSWDFDAGDSIQDSASGVQTQYVYNTAGIYTVTLIAADAAGNAASDTLTVTVVRPLADVQIYRISAYDAERDEKYYVRAYLRNLDAQAARVTAHIDIFDPLGRLVSWSGLDDQEVIISRTSTKTVTWRDTVTGSAEEGIYTAVVSVLQEGTVLDTESSTFRVKKHRW